MDIRKKRTCQLCHLKAPKLIAILKCLEKNKSDIFTGYKFKIIPIESMIYGFASLPIKKSAFITFKTNLKTSLSYTELVLELLESFASTCLTIYLSQSLDLSLLTHLLAH